MCLAQEPQRSDAGEALTRGPSVSSQALYHSATALLKPACNPCEVVLQNINKERYALTINNSDCLRPPYKSAYLRIIFLIIHPYG